MLMMSMLSRWPVGKLLPLNKFQSRSRVDGRWQEVPEREDGVNQTSVDKGKEDDPAG